MRTRSDVTAGTGAVDRPQEHKYDFQLQLGVSVGVKKCLGRENPDVVAESPFRELGVTS